MTLTNQEFVRRFAMHILPKRFVRIRHYGILSSSWKRDKLQQLQSELKVLKPETKLKTMLRKCPCCKIGTLVTIEVFGKRGPPKIYIVEKQIAVQALALWVGDVLPMETIKTTKLKRTTTIKEKSRRPAC